MKRVTYVLHSLLLIAAMAMIAIPLAAATEKSAAEHE